MPIAIIASRRRRRGLGVAREGLYRRAPQSARRAMPTVWGGGMTRHPGLANLRWNNRGKLRLEHCRISGKSTAI